MRVLAWAKDYQPRWLASDAVAGATLGAYAIPVSLAYASLAGVPSQIGVYCYLVGGLGYVLFASSRHLAIGPTSAISLIAGTALLASSGGDPVRQAELASMAALVTGVMFVLAYFLRLGVIASFISDSLLLGFKAGAALVIASTQLPKLFAVKGGGDDFIERLWVLGHQLGNAQLLALTVGLSAIVLLLAGEKLLPGRPVALGVVILSLIVVSLFGLDQHGLKVVGRLQPGLPSFSSGSFDPRHYRDMLSLAFACFLLSYIESISAARTFALKHGYDVDSRMELLGLGSANLLVGLFQGYPIAGGLSQSAVNEKAGAKSPMSLVFASVLLAIVLLFLTGFFRALPDAVLAAVVLVAVKGLIDIPALRHLLRVSRSEFAVSMAALAGVLVMGILDGIVLAAIASLLIILTRAANPHVAFLGRIPGTNRYSDMERHPDNEPLRGVLAFRVEAALFYFNVDHVRRVVLDRIDAMGPDLELVLCDLSNCAWVDTAGAKMLRRLCDDLATRCIHLRVVEAHGRERDMLRAEGLEKVAGPISRQVLLTDVMDGVTARPLAEWNGSGPA